MVAENMYIMVRRILQISEQWRSMMITGANIMSHGYTITGVGFMMVKQIVTLF